MQTILHAHAAGARHDSAALSDHLSTLLHDALGRFGDRVTRVETNLIHADGAASFGDQGTQCSMLARLKGMDEVFVKDQARSAHQAIEGAVRKLKRAVGAAVAQQDPRRPASTNRSRRDRPALATQADAAAEAPTGG